MPEHDPENENEDPNLAQLRKKAERADELEKQLADADAVRKENIALKAGLKLSDKQMRALMSTHEGDWTAEAILESARELGFVRDAEPEEPKVPDSELAAHDRIVDASSGGTPSTWDPHAEIDALDVNDPQFEQKLAAITQKAQDPVQL